MATTVRYEITAKDKSKKAIKSAQKNINGLKSAVGGLVGIGGFALLTKALIGQINTYSNLSNRLKLVTKDAKELAEVQRTLFDVAQDTRGSLEGTIDIYTRFARSTKALKLSQEELAQITTTVNQTLIISGASTQAANAAIVQLGQGLASGVLRGQELNSILEQTPRLAAAIAKGMGVATGKLKSLGEQGKITSKAVVDALKSQANAVGDEFGKMDKTIAQAFVQIENSFLQTFGTVKGGGLVQSLDEFREIISDPDVVTGLQAIAQALIEIVSIGTKAIGVFSKIGTALGENLSQLINPIESIKRVGELNIQIHETELLLKGMQESLGKESLVDKLFGKSSEREFEFAQKVDAAREKLRLLNEERDKFITPTKKIIDSVDAPKPSRLKEFDFDRFKAANDALDQATETANASTLEQFANQLNKERAHEEKRLDMLTAFTNERILLAKEEQKIKLQVLSSGLGAASSILANVSALMSKEGKKQNETTRLLARLSIVASTAQAVMNALAVPPYPLGVSLAVAAGLQGARELAKVGGSGQVSNVAELSQRSTAVNQGVPPSIRPEAAQQQPVNQFFITGAGNRSDDEIIDLLRTALNDQDITIIDPDSRQAQEIRESV